MADSHGGDPRGVLPRRRDRRDRFLGRLFRRGDPGASERFLQAPPDHPDPARQYFDPGAVHPRHQRGAAEDRLGAHPGFRRPRLLARRFRRRHHQRRELAPQHPRCRPGSSRQPRQPRKPPPQRPRGNRPREEGGALGMSSLTPAMRQYLEIKARYPDCILFFRMGDFYEMFFEDAVLASKLLDITLTSRDKGREDSVPLCGFPWHAASSYIAKLIGKGYKVAICEQMEDPRLAKGIVKREVVRVVTPGLVVDPDNLEAKQNNFLAGIAVLGEVFGLSFLDISTGEFRVTEIVDRNFFIDEVSRHGFREIILEENLKDAVLETALTRELEDCVINRFPRDWFDHAAALAVLGEHVPAESIARLEPERHPAMIAAAGAV